MIAGREKREILKRRTLWDHFKLKAVKGVVRVLPRMTDMWSSASKKDIFYHKVDT